MKRISMPLLFLALSGLYLCGIASAQPGSLPPKCDIPCENSEFAPEVLRAIQKAYERGFNRGFEQGYQASRKMHLQDRPHRDFGGEFRGHGPRGGYPMHGKFRGHGPRGEHPMHGEFRGHGPHGGWSERGEFRGPDFRGKGSERDEPSKDPRAHEELPK